MLCFVSVVAVSPPINWSKGKLLGAGAFGQVFLCHDHNTGRQLAVKVVDIDPHSDPATQKVCIVLCREVFLFGRVKMYCRNYTGTVRLVLCREVYYSVSLFGKVPYWGFNCIHTYSP